MEPVFKIKGYKLLFCILFLFVFIGTAGCATEKTAFIGELKPGIFYKETIYWETGTEKNVGNIKKIGEIKQAEESGVFPRTSFSATSSLKDDVGKEIYSGDGKLYLKDEKTYRIFQFITEMDLGEEVKEIPEPDAESMYRPHLVMDNMRYWMTSSDLTVEEIPKSFPKTGEIMEEVLYAAKNNTAGSIDIGTKWFASDFQNRYIIVQYTDDTLDIYENEAYHPF